MPSDKKEPTRLELYKAGKLEERSARRPSLDIEKAKKPVAKDTGKPKLRIEITVIGLMVLVLIILTLIGMGS